MAIDFDNDSNYISKEEKIEVRKLVLLGLEQIKHGKTNDFEEVCDRLEKKYSKVTRSIVKW